MNTCLPINELSAFYCRCQWSGPGLLLRWFHQFYLQRRQGAYWAFMVVALGLGASGLALGQAGTTVAGGNGEGSAPNQLDRPYGVFVDGAGNRYVADQYNHRIQKFGPNSTSASSGTTVAGGNGYGSTPNRLAFPEGVFIDGAGNLLVADTYNHRIQQFTPNTAPTVATVIPAQTATVGQGFSYTLPANAFSDAQTPNSLTYSATISPANGLVYDAPTGVISGTPTATGVSTVTVIATDPGSLTASQSFTITVNCPVLTATLTSNGPLSCTSTSVLLTASGGSTYHFSSGATQVGNGPTATVSSAGVYSVTVVNANGCSATASTTVTSNTTAPAISITPPVTTICAGQSATLTATPGLSTYRWSSGQTTATISVTAAGTYSVMATSSGGCSSTASARLTLNPRPAAPYATPISRRLYTTNFPIPLLLYALPTSFSTDLRFYNGATNTAIDPAVVRPNQPGVSAYYATQTDNKGCESLPTPFSLTVLDGGTLVSKPADRIVCQGTSTVLSVTATGSNLQYAWYEANPDTPLRVSEVGSDTKNGKTANLTVNNVRQTKLYYCLVIGDKGIGVAGPIRVGLKTDCGSGARVASGEPSESLQVRVLGNPVTGHELSMEVRGAEGQPLQLTLTDLQGRSVSEQQVERAGALERQTLRVGTQPTGILLLRVSTPTQTKTTKVLISE